jgi:hypothetical protein
MSDLAECVVCGVSLDEDDERWGEDGWPYCPDCYADAADEWQPDEDVVPVVDVPVGEYL